MEYLVIDGYNVINAWDDMFDLKNNPLEEARNEFLIVLSNYQGYTKSNIIVVFDAHLLKGSIEKQEQFDNILVIYTKENETADNYIERFVYKNGSSNTIRVVTYDYLEQTMILSVGGVRMSPRELREEMMKGNKRSRVSSDNVLKKDNTVFSNVDKETFERLEKMRRGKF